MHQPMRHGARQTPDEIELRRPTTADGAAMWDLVRRDQVLDDNSCYAYLLLCRHHAETCVVAYRSVTLAGFVSAYIPPRQPDVLFVWQIAVNPALRQRGLGKRLLRKAMALPACKSVRYLEATVSPSNRASRRMFQAFADEHSAEFRIGGGFSRAVFPSASHEEEPLIRIGPLELADACISRS